MGLDMYLDRHIYVGAQFEWRKCNIPRTIEVQDSFDDENPKISTIEVNPDRISYIVEQAIYWRKVNAIHKWFVDNVQNGVDEGGMYYVSYSQLGELLELCEWVLDNKDEAETALPTQAGFFFGSTEYNEWYFKDIEFTKNQLEELLNKSNAKDCSYYYTASW